VINQQRRVSMLLEEARKRLPAPFTEKQLVAITDEEKHALDAVYVSFEDMFRGTRAEIKDRHRVYLPFLQEQKIGTKQMPILDLGCGRGEWLELLLEHKLKARGIDRNRVLVEYCREAGLSVAEEDILEHLKNQPDRSLGAVTGFHIIEHLPFDILIRVFDETVRVLKPGGIAIFETPNPQNVLVGSHNFYLDFTHRNPLPSLTTQFLLEARGLCDVRILNLHPYPESSKLQEDRTELAKRFNEFFYGPQDYAVIGRKA
jgi:O-antigen chain-terminating methyltransferase